MINRLFKNKDVKVIILEVFLIVLGLVGLTLGVKYIMNSINVNVDTSKLAIDNMNANVTNGTLMPIEDSSVNINTTSNVLRITFDVKGASTNTGNNIIYDAILNIDADCSLKNESVKWNLYKNNNLLTSGSTSPKYDRDVLNGKITLTDTQQDLVPYSKTADKYVFILWMSESCNEEDITKCDLSKALTSDSGGKSISGNIDIRLNSGKKKENNRETVNVNNVCEETKATYIVEHLDDNTGDSGGGVYNVTHSAIPAESSATGSEIPAVTDYRYYGHNPNNYICLDMESGSTCPDKHLYRIIGSIYEEKSGENLLKVIKATPLTDGTTSKFQWDIKSDGTHSNIWSTTTSGTSSGSASMQLLNGIWLARGSGSYYHYNHDDDITNDFTVDFTNYGPSDKAQSLINTTSRYYLGGYSDYSLKIPDIYLAERGTTTSSGNSKYWDGKIALMYLSDYGYASGNTCVTEKDLYHYLNDGCGFRNWIIKEYDDEFYWTITPVLSTADVVWVNVDYSNVCNSYRVRPTFYLKPTTTISSGDGTIDTPYLLAD